MPETIQIVLTIRLYLMHSNSKKMIIVKQNNIVFQQELVVIV